jgi:hypothetical protein
MTDMNRVSILGLVASEGVAAALQNSRSSPERVAPGRLQ